MPSNCAHTDSAGGEGRPRRGLRKVVTTPVGAALATLAAVTVLAPGVALAADRITAIVSDPADATAQLRVTSDGRLGVRGDVGTYPDIPLGAWNSVVDLAVSDGSFYKAALVHQVPAGMSAAVSGLHVFVKDGNRFRYVTLVSHPAETDGTCKVPDGDLGWPAVVAADLDRDRSDHRDVDLSIPAVVPAAGTSTCLFALATYPIEAFDDGNGVGFTRVQVTGIDGAAPQRFAPPQKPK